MGRLREILWPSMGFARLTRYYRQRMVRLPGTPHSIVAGFACGAAVSFTPFLGFHFLLGAVVAYAIRGNIVAAAIGTAVGNPWTFPFIWYFVYETGQTILSGESIAVPWDALSFAYLYDHIGDVLVPMIFGGILIAVAVFPLFYFPMVRMLCGFRHRRFQHRMRRAQARSWAETQTA